MQSEEDEFLRNDKNMNLPLLPRPKRGNDPKAGWLEDEDISLLFIGLNDQIEAQISSWFRYQYAIISNIFQPKLRINPAHCLSILFISIHLPLYMLPPIFITIRFLAMAEKSKFDFSIEPYEIEPQQLFKPYGIEAILSRIENQTSTLPKVLQQRTQQLEVTVTALINQRFSNLEAIIMQLQNRIDRLSFEGQREEDVLSIREQNSDCEQISESEFGGGLVSRREESDDGERSLMNIDKTSYMESVLDIPEIMQDSDRLLARLQDSYKEMGLLFTDCEKVYDFPDMRQLNFHERIDNLNNLFFLAQLQNSQLVGAFTQQCFDPKPILIPRENPRSFLCNLGKETFVYADRANRTHTYDKNYLIFGNWEIKIKAGEDLLYTNWGTNGDCFLRQHFGRAEKTKVRLEWLFGNGAALRQGLRMQRYHIYIFK